MEFKRPYSDSAFRYICLQMDVTDLWDWRTIVQISGGPPDLD